MPQSIPVQVQAQDINAKLDNINIKLNFNHGSAMSISQVRKERYVDEYTNDHIPDQHVRDAMTDELEYMCREVVVGVKLSDVLADPDHSLVSGRLENCSNADSQSPKCKGRYVAQDVNPGGEANPSFYSAPPPLEATRMPPSRWANEHTRDDHPLLLHVLDVRNAYFNATQLPRRNRYVRLPPKLGMGRGVGQVEEVYERHSE